MKIYIGNLPYGGQIKEDVQRLFSRYGEAWGCVIIKTYGFIHMEKEDGNEAIKQLDGYMLEGKCHLGLGDRKRMRVEKFRGRLEMFNPVFDGNFCRFGGLRPSDYENNCNNVLAPFNSARVNCLNQLGDFNCNRLAGAGLGKPVCDHSFKSRMAGSNVFRDSGLYGLGNSVGNCSGDNLARDVNDWRNQVNYLERKIKHLETEKTEFNLRRQVQYLQKRVRDLQEEKKVYMDQELNDDGGRSLSDYQTNLRSSKAGKRVRPPTPESSTKKSTTIRHAKNKHKYETENMSDDDIQVIDASDDEDDIKIVEEREEEDVKILSESKLKEVRIFRKRGRDDTVNYISKNEGEIMSVNVSKRPKSLTKDGSKNRMRSEKFDEEGDWGVVKSERCNDGDVPLIYLDDEKDDVKDDFANESIIKNSSVKDDQKMQNMSDGLGEVFDDENFIQGVPPLDQVLARFRCSHTPTQ